MQQRNHFIMDRYMLVVILKRRVGIAQLVERRTTGLDDTGLIPGSERFLSSQRRPARLWGAPSPLCKGYRGSLSRGQSARGVNLTTHLHLLPNSRMVELYLYSPIHFHCVAFNVT
jgi:hypothetical protein